MVIKEKKEICFFGEKINSYKIFNYLLQSAETEKNCEVILKLNKFLEDVKSKIYSVYIRCFFVDMQVKVILNSSNKCNLLITSNDKYVGTYMGKPMEI